MENKKRSEKFLRKRKMLMVMPLLVIPFITIGFYALGGGQGKVNAVVQNQGLNLNLPAASVKDEQSPTKLTFYEKVEEAERQREKELANDNYFQVEETGDDEPVEEKINEKIKRLEEEINRPAEKVDFPPSYKKQFDGDVDRLGEMVSMMQEKQADDPEMRQLDTLMEKILDVQHPERVRNRLQAKPVTEKDNLFFVSRYVDEPRISVIGGSPINPDSARFYSWQTESATALSTNVIEAVVQETQTLSNGSVIRLRLVSDATVDGTLIPKGSFVVGIVSVNGERLKVAINSIRSQHSIYPVRMEVYDLDGLPGIYVPGAITRDVAKQSADNSLDLIDPTSMNQSFASQATAAGIDAAKNLLSRKAKLIRVTVKAGYRVLLTTTDKF